MTSRPAGRHRKGVSTQWSPGLPWLEYPAGDGAPGVFLNSGVVPNGDPLFSPNGNSLFSPAGGRRALRAALARDRRAFALALSAAVAGVTAAVVFGSFAPLHSTWMADGGPGAPGGLPPQTPVPWSAAPLGSPSGAPVPPGRPQGPPQGRPRPPGERPASPRLPRHKREPRASRGTGTRQETGSRADIGQGPGAATQVSTGRGTGNSSPHSPRHARPAPKLLVRYLVDRQWPDGFQGQVQVVNNGAQPIADWQVVVALPGDTVTSFSNASGYVSDHILLLQPASAAQVVPPGGGTLDVFFAASGAETAPAACAFNRTLCG
jgi:hypothetical protein